MVGSEGFEPTTSCSQSKRTSQTVLRAENRTFHSGNVERSRFSQLNVVVGFVVEPHKLVPLMPQSVSQLTIGYCVASMNKGGFWIFKYLLSDPLSKVLPLTEVHHTMFRVAVNKFLQLFSAFLNLTFNEQLTKTKPRHFLELTGAALTSFSSSFLFLFFVLLFLPSSLLPPRSTKIGLPCRPYIWSCLARCF